MFEEKKLVYPVYKDKKLDYNDEIVNCLKVGKEHERKCMIQRLKWQNDF